MITIKRDSSYFWANNEERKLGKINTQKRYRRQTEERDGNST